MTRILLPTIALVLVVTACGAGLKPAPQVTEAGAHVPAGHALVAERKRAALIEARSLEREFTPRYLDVTAVALPDRTVLRVDALTLWIYPRSPGERAPGRRAWCPGPSPRASATRSRSRSAARPRGR